MQKNTYVVKILILCIFILSSCVDKKNPNDALSQDQKNIILSEINSAIIEITSESRIIDSIYENQDFSNAQRVIGNARRKGYSEYIKEKMEIMKDDLSIEKLDYLKLEELTKDFQSAKKWSKTDTFQ